MTAGFRLLVHRVSEIVLADEASFDAGRLVVARSELEALLADPALARVRFDVTLPGESARIVKVLDAIEPRAKEPGSGRVFPGLLGPAHPQGRGATHVLEGAAVITAGYLPRAQEAVVEMAGPAAKLSPFGSTCNLVISFQAAKGAPWEEVDAALRRGALQVAEHLALVAAEQPPDEVVEPQPPGRYEELPRVGTIVNLQTQGAFKDVLVYGRSFAGSLPVLIDPDELEDGAVVCAQYGHPALRNPTYIHQNAPVVRALRARHGVDLSLAGVVLSPEPVEQADKELISALAARLCQLAGFDAAIVTKEGGGNADADVSLKLDALEELGVAAVGLFAEMAGRDGTDPGVVAPPRGGAALISTGNYDATVTLPAVARALGGGRLDIAGCSARAAVELPYAALLCALSPQGWGRLTCRAA